MRGQTLLAQPFDVDRLVFTGDPEALAEQVVTGGGIGTLGAFSVSGAGVLAYETGAADIGGNSDPLSQLIWFDRSGTRLATLGEPARQQNAQLTSDDKRVAVNIFDATRRTRDIWLLDTARGLRTQ